MTYEEALLLLTHRCARDYGHRINPEYVTKSGLPYCEARRSKKRDNPSLAQYNSTWICEGCPGPIPDCSREDWEKLKFTGHVGVHGHIHRVMGTKDKPRKPRAPRPSKAKPPGQVCKKCGGPIQIRCNSNQDRLDLGWCFHCFEKVREKIRSRDKRDRKRIITGKDGKPVVIMPWKPSTERKGGGL